MRYSKQRNLVYEIVLKSMDHPTAEVIYQRARYELPNISLGTVYRNLNELVKLNKIRKINIQDGSDRFDITLEPHMHFYCQYCKNVVDLDENSFNDFIDKLETNNNIKIVSRQISFTGICSKCQK